MVLLLVWMVQIELSPALEREDYCHSRCKSDPCSRGTGITHFHFLLHSPSFVLQENECQIHADTNGLELNMLTRRRCEINMSTMSQSDLHWCALVVFFFFLRHLIGVIQAFFFFFKKKRMNRIRRLYEVIFFHWYENKTKLNLSGCTSDTFPV